MRSTRFVWLAALAVVLAPCSAPAADSKMVYATPSFDTSSTPKTAPSLDAIRAWLDRHKGYGAPNETEAKLADMHVFVTWNIPWSGSNETDYWIYCAQKDGWRLLKHDTFQPIHDQAWSAQIDASRHVVRFLDDKGVLQFEAPVDGCRSSR
jgi:hypothetical protein